MYLETVKYYDFIWKAVLKKNMLKIDEVRLCILLDMSNHTEAPGYLKMRL